MADMNSVVMCIFGGVLGILGGAFPRRSLSATPYDLNQEWKFAQNITFCSGIVIAIAAIVLTALTFQWKPFFGAMLVAGVIANQLSFAVLEGRMGVRWTSALRSLHRNESYRYVPYAPSHGPCLDRFDPSASSSNGNALVCAHLSWLAYRSENELQEQSVGWSARVRFLQERNHAGLIVAMPSAVIVAFRGTDDVRDWLTNVAFWQRSPWGTDWGAMHAGFLSPVDALWLQLLDALREVGSGQRVWFTGHSLGGAMAVLAAVRLLQERPEAEIGGICTFGQPMVGNSVFVRTLEQRLGGRYVRFEASRDEIPYQPPLGTHGGTLLYFNRNGVLYENPGFFAKLWDGARRDALGFAGDHPMREYLRLIDQRYQQSSDAQSASELSV